ncbi:hypothetical protein Pmani_032105 [Petrolisthes manimaculis]|uniref:Uncharacterized protein n=1 Tax=Petrolisthes manimaculis TaxID=1843537 RepID=A0AAE1NUC7_9EUCA|nr:hypothetical protein Pmani_032105 [Petrolisthes manimaculis]
MDFGENERKIGETRGMEEEVEMKRNVGGGRMEWGGKDGAEKNWSRERRDGRKKGRREGKEQLRKMERERSKVWRKGKMVQEESTGWRELGRRKGGKEGSWVERENRTGEITKGSAGKKRQGRKQEGRERLRERLGTDQN